MKRYLAAAAGAALFAGLAGCTAANTDTAAAAPQQPTASSSSCETPSTALVEKIGSVLNGGATVTRASAVRSADFEKVWMVAAQLKIPGTAKTDPAVFAVNDLDGTGLLLAVGGVAHQFSSMGHAEDTAMGASLTSDGFDASVKCLKDAS